MKHQDFTKHLLNKQAIPVLQTGGMAMIKEVGTTLANPRSDSFVAYGSGFGAYTSNGINTNYQPQTLHP